MVCGQCIQVGSWKAGLAASLPWQEVTAPLPCLGTSSSQEGWHGDMASQDRGSQGTRGTGALGKALSAEQHWLCRRSTMSGVSSINEAHFKLLLDP